MKRRSMKHHLLYAEPFLGTIETLNSVLVKVLLPPTLTLPTPEATPLWQPSGPDFWSM